MKFSTWVEGDKFFIRGEMIESHGDTLVGPRYQGPFDELTMDCDTVWYNYLPKNLGADELAIICFMIFFPWIGHTIEFPKSVSTNVLEAINHPTFTRFKGEIKINNMNTEEPVKHETMNNVVFPEDVVISFGGGADSSALHVLFPEATLVHEVNVQEVQDVSNRATIRAMVEHNLQRGTPIHWIQTNARFLSLPNGVTNWLAPLIPALLVACNQGKKTVFAGSNIGTMFLKDGKEYQPCHQMKNPARDILSNHTVPIVQASAHISVATAYRLCNEGNIIPYIHFCENGPNQGNCSKCMKCLRRELVFRALCHAFPDEYDLNELAVNTDTFVEKYNIETANKMFHYTSHAPYTHNFVIGRDLMGDEYPIELLPFVAQAPPSSFLFARPEEADDLFPPMLREHILPRIHERIRKMTEREHIVFLTWRA